MRIIILVISLFSFLLAEKISFIPSSQAHHVKNEIKNNDMFDKKYIKLPSSTNFLEYIKFGYQKDDGSIEEKTIDINTKINNKELLVLTTKKKLDIAENMAKVYPKNTQVSSEFSFADQFKSNDTNLNKIKDFKVHEDFSFNIADDTLKIFTKDTLIKYFALPNKNKFVLDFKSEKAFATKDIKIEQGKFKDVKIGSHKNFYRASFSLNSPFKYTMQKKIGEITIDIK